MDKEELSTSCGQKTNKEVLKDMKSYKKTAENIGTERNPQILCLIWKKVKNWTQGPVCL